MAEVKKFDTIPDGWKILEKTNTQPVGYVWISNGKSRFGGEYEHALARDPRQREAES